MLGSNYIGQPYYGQGPAVATVYITHSVNATVSTSATISSKILAVKTLSATVSTTATISKAISIIRTATVTASGTFDGLVILSLNIKRAITKFLYLGTTTKSIAGCCNHSKPLDEKKSTRIITDPL
jgi:hypothetical protein